MGQLLASALFSALSKRPNALEPEDEGRSLHDPVIDGSPKTCSAISAGNVNCGIEGGRIGRAADWCRVLLA